MLQLQKKQLNCEINMKEAYLIKNNHVNKDIFSIEAKILVFDKLEQKSIKIIGKYVQTGDFNQYRMDLEKVNCEINNLTWDIIYKKMDELNYLLTQLDKANDQIFLSEESCEAIYGHQASLFRLNALIYELDEEIKALIEGADQARRTDLDLARMEYDLHADTDIREDFPEAVCH